MTHFDSQRYNFKFTDECKKLITINNCLYYLQEKYGPVGMVHIDAHSDTNDTMLGEKIAHGTPFR
jgi:hypothetical protein